LTLGICRFVKGILRDAKGDREIKNGESQSEQVLELNLGAFRIKAKYEYPDGKCQGLPDLIIANLISNYSIHL